MNETMTNFDEKNQVDISETVEINEEAKIPKMFFPLKIFEYLFLAALVCAGTIAIVFPDNQKFLISGAVFLSVFIFLLLINTQLFSESKKVANQSEMIKKAEIYTYLLSENNPSLTNPITPARSKALQYCQELIEDYKKTRRNSRNIYYISQISTIVLSGVTPILVLAERLESGPLWLKWLPVICPALAAIVASIVTSFPFQENWIAANTTVELLEAEQEKFILGVTQPYRCYDLSDSKQRQQKAKQAIENFMTQVNNIHLKQVQQLSKVEVEGEKTEPNKSIELDQPTQ